MICPGFAADCLETLEEIADEGRETFLHAGGKTFNYVPVCNDSEPFIHALAAVATQHLQGLIPLDKPTDKWDAHAAKTALEASANRARGLGASQ